MSTTHTITVTLSDRAQRGAILAGEPAAAQQTYPVVDRDLVERLLALPWATISAEGTVTCAVPPAPTVEHATLRAEPGAQVAHERPQFGARTVDGRAGARPADAAAAIAWGETVRDLVRTHVDNARREHQIAEARARAEEAPYLAAVAEFLRLPVAEQAAQWAALPYDVARRVPPEATQAIRAHRTALDEATRRADDEAKVAHISARLPEIDSAAAAQWADGLLCRDVAIGIIAADVLDRIAPPYDDQTCDDRDCTCGWTSAACVPPHLYPAVVALRETVAAAGGTIDDLYTGAPHRLARGLTRDATPTHLIADLAVQDGPLRLTRTVLVGDAAK